MFAEAATTGHTDSANETPVGSDYRKRMLTRVEVFAEIDEAVERSTKDKSLKTV